MANETEKGNITFPTDEVSDLTARALVENVKLLPYVNAKPVPSNTDTVKFRRKGSLTAEALAESTAYTFSASSEYTETALSLTASKIVAVSKLTVEAERITDADISMLAQELGAGIGRKLDADVKALADGFSTNVGGAAVLTGDVLLDGSYTVRNAMADDGQLVAAFGYEQVRDLEKDIESNSGAVYSNPQLPLILNGYNGSNGVVGRFMGTDIVAMGGLPMPGTERIGAIFNPRLAFAGIYEAVPTINATWVGSGGFYWEVTAHTFAAVGEWNDGAGVEVQSTGV